MVTSIVILATLGLGALPQHDGQSVVSVFSDGRLANGHETTGDVAVDGEVLRIGRGGSLRTHVEAAPAALLRAHLARAGAFVAWVGLSDSRRVAIVAHGDTVSLTSGPPRDSRHETRSYQAPECPHTVWELRYVWGSVTAVCDGQKVATIYLGADNATVTAAGVDSPDGDVFLQKVTFVGVEGAPEPPADDPDLTVLRHRLAESRELVSAGRYGPALVASSEAVAAARKAYGPVSMPVTFLLSGQADILGLAGHWKDAIATAQESVRLRRNLVGPEHPIVAEGLLTLANLQTGAASFSSAREAVAESRQILTTVDHGAEPLRAAMWLRRGNLEQTVGDFSAAIDSYRAALKVQAQCPTHAAEMAATRGNLGAVLIHVGHYEQAQIQLERALDSWRGLGDSGRVALTLGNLGALYGNLGDVSKALASYRAAIEIYDTTSNGQDPSVLFALNGMGELMRAIGELSTARLHFAEALGRVRGFYGDQHPLFAAALNNLAVVMIQEDPEAALALHVQALELRRDLLHDGHPAIGESLSNVGATLIRMGKNAEAIPYLEQAVTVNDAFLPEGHPRAVAAFRHLAAAHVNLGRLDKARALLERAYDLEIEFVGELLPSLSEAEALLYLRSAWDTRDELLGVLRKSDAPDSRMAYESAWRSRSFATRILLRRRRLLADDAVARELHDKIGATRRELAGAAFAPVGMLSPQFLERIAGLVEAKERLERELAKRLGREFSNEGSTARIDDLIRSLPSDVVVIDFVRIRDQYDAFVLRPEESGAARIEWIPLSRADSIDRAVDAVRQVMQTPDTPTDQRALRVITDLVWSRLEPYLGTATTVVVMPDGALSRIPWSALVGQREGQFVVHDRAVVTASHGPGILELLRRSRGNTDSLLLVGDVSYAGQSPEPPTARRPASQKWSSLPWTRLELRSIASLYRARGNQVQTLSGYEATEQALRDQLSSATTVHLATHGFFAGDKLPTVFGTRSRLDPSILLGSQIVIFDRNPMLLSGIVLAGANEPTAEESDGIMTAEELVTLDLRNVQLMVFSACETGLGRVAGGEGSYGLTRAAELAGVRAAVASLWQVDDAATMALMLELYRNRLAGLGAAEALRSAQLTMMNHYDPRRRKLRDPEGVLLPRRREPLNPAYWAGFSLHGDWR